MERKTFKDGSLIRAEHKNDPTVKYSVMLNEKLMVGSLDVRQKTCQLHNVSFLFTKQYALSISRLFNYEYRR